MQGNKLAIVSGIVVVLVVLAIFVLSSMMYIVDERQQAVVLQFGRPVKARTEPGLYFKTPFVQHVEMLPRTRQFWGGTARFALPDLPTKDDKKIEITPWAMWRINDPIVFVQRLRTMENAEERVAQFTRGAMRDVITQYDLAELVRSTDRALYTSSGQVGAAETEPPSETEPTEVRRVRMNIQHGRPKILDQIEAEAKRRLAGESGSSTEAVGRGIELIDLGISQIEFVESVRTKTFDRWIAERDAVSAKNTSEGERMKQEIINQAMADVERITGEGQQKANELRGAVDAEIIRDYAEAIKETGDFFTFVRTLEAFEKSIGKDTRMILTTDSDFLGLLKTLPAAPQSEPAGDPQ